MVTLQQAITATMRYSQPPPSLLAALSYLNIASAHSYSGSSNTSCSNAGNSTVDLTWHAPAQSQINSLASAINSTGTYGFIYNSSQGPPDTYNWCNMPHVNPKTYPIVKDPAYKLQYVEVIHRHHKRTPYASNTFPVESYPWSCSDQGLFYGGAPLNPSGNASASTYWSVSTSPSNPLAPTGFNGSCQFPQITRTGLDDSHQHGVDLKAVYADLLSFIPASYDASATSYRVTNNVITSQVASMLLAGMYSSLASAQIPLTIQPPSIDSLEPSYTCPTATALFARYGVSSTSPAWQAHLHAAAPLFARLDAVSGIEASNADWHKSLDHYFDNLSARLCHAKPLPCNVADPSSCISLSDAEQVFRLGQYEYSYIYRDAPESLRASVASYGIWIAELASNLREAIAGNGAAPRYRHNVAHDGSMSRLLSILQLERMVWPGMGAEVVFELYKASEASKANEASGASANETNFSGGNCWFVRALWGGQVLVSSHPALGRMEMVPVGVLLGYFDGLVGRGAGEVVGLCGRQG